MINPTYPGVYVREESSGARAVAGVATSITAFIGMTQRGPLGLPKRIFNLQDYERSFGGGSTGGEMLPQVKLFFDNGGGEAFVTRIAEGAQQADIDLHTEDGPGNVALTLTAKEHGIAGNKLRASVSYSGQTAESRFTLTLYREVLTSTGMVEAEATEVHSNLTMDPGDPNHVVSVLASRSALVSAAAGGGAPQTNSQMFSGLVLPTVANDAAGTIRTLVGAVAGPADLDFQLSYNGNPARTASITIGNGANLAAIRTAISDGVTAALNAAGFNPAVAVTTDLIAGAGSPRQLVISVADGAFELLPGSGNDLLAPLMLSPASGGIYADRYAALRPAPTGYVSRVIETSGAADFALSRLLTTGALAKANVADITITDTLVTVAPAAQAIAYPDPAAELWTGTAYVPGAGDDTVGTLSNLAQNLGAIAEAINNGFAARWSAEVQGYRLVLRSTQTGADADIDAALTTSDGGGGGTDLTAAGQIFDAGVGGVTLANVAAYSLGTSPAPGGDFQDRAGATDGDDGNIPTEARYREAFATIDEQVDLFNLMVLPRAQDAVRRQTDDERKAAFNAASSFCALQRAFLLADPTMENSTETLWTSADAAGTGVDTFRTGIDTRNAAVFWPRLRTADGKARDPAGAMAGLMARIDGTRGVWKAAAGVEATVRGVTGVEVPMSDQQNGILNPKALNALRIFPDGVLSWGARTLVGFNDSGNIDDKYIPVRRTMLYIEESLYRGLRFAVFEPNDEPLWSQIRLAAGSFMNGLFRQGAFAGTKASDAYYVLCDQSTTTATDINLGIVNVVVAFAPLKPAEFVVLTVKQIAGQAQV